MIYALMCQSGSGFTNQIFSLVTSIILAHSKKQKVVMIDKFLNDIHHNNYTPISEILDLDKMNEYLKKYDVILVDRCNSKIDQIKIFYGVETKNIDVTEKIFDNFCTTNGILIPKRINLNGILGDPCYGTVKNLFVNYQVNQHIITEIYNETFTEDIVLDVHTKYKNTFGWINSINQEMFDDILTHIYFQKDLIEKAETMIPCSYTKVNVIHLRLEDDIVHWAIINGMNEEDFRKELETKYIEQIKQNISKEELTIVLSQSLDNPVLDYLKEHNYPYQVNTKFFHEREKDAIVDLLISSACNHIFIGNFNIPKLNGSSFSYFIGKRLPHVRKINIDLDRIHDPAQG